MDRPLAQEVGRAPLADLNKGGTAGRPHAQLVTVTLKVWLALP